VADPASFIGFTALLIAPLTAALLAGEMDREHVFMLLLVVLFTPFMAMVHRRAHLILAEQLRSGARLRMAEEETGRRRDILNALLASAPASIVVLDGEGRVIRVNPAFERTMAHPRDAARHRPFVELVTDERDRAPLVTFLELVREGRRTTADLPVRRGDGAARWMRFSGTLGHGSVEGTVILVGEDVTEQVDAREDQMMARIHAEEAARAKSSFLASMSHEIRTPLNGILGMIEILLDSELTREQRQAAQVIRDSGRGLLRILNDILDVSKMEAGQLDLEVVDFALHDLVADVARMFTVAAVDRGDEIVIDIDRNVPEAVRGDPHRIRQVLSNLVGNAVKFTDGGEIVLGLRQLGEVDDRHRVHFSVADTGVGIPSEKQELIFRAFEQADSSTARTHGGTGLGLSISRRLVELMGGRIELDSAQGRGSDFHFVLELPRGAVERTHDTREPRPIEFGGRRFLVVDDNATARRIVREALIPIGGEVVEAEGAAAGLAELGAAGKEGRGFDAVILDHMMPGQDGFTFARRLREGESDGGALPPPILMVTSAVPAHGTERARAVGIAGYLAKPVSRAELYRALAAMLDGGPAPGPERRLVTRESIGRAATKARILLAEDNAVNRQVAVGLLQRRGHEVVAVCDGADAVRTAVGGTFDLVLMDIQMPGMDGLDASRRIRAQCGEALPIIALTAHAFAEERERCRAAGMDDFLAKPFKPNELYGMVERWVGDVERRGAPRAEERAHMGEQGEDVGRAPVDLDGFRSVMREAGVEEVVGVTLDVYLTEAPQLFSGLEGAVEKGEAEEVRRAAHSLKSASGNIRAKRLAELLQRMEDHGGGGEVEQARIAMAALRDEYEAVIRYLRADRGV
jgi:PAS domain S-box-containing protein